MTSTVTAVGARVAIEVDPLTGMLSGLSLPGESVAARLPVSMRATMSLGGREVRGATGGIVYLDTEKRSEVRLQSEPVVVADGDDVVVTVPTTIESWHLDWVWRLHAGSQPGVSLALHVTAPASGAAPLRDLQLSVSVDLGAPEGWLVDAPGNMLRRSVPVTDLPMSVSIEPPAGSRGSSGIVRLAGADDLCLVLWPLCVTELADVVLRPVHTRGRAGVELEIDTHLAAELPHGGTLVYQGLRLDLARRTFDETVDDVQKWYRTIGITAPGDAPAWVAGASIYEVFIGRAVFWNDHEYAPYPTMQSLIDDLDRIQSLGMTVVQLMPRHPYPSYNIHDFDDISTTYGDEHELLALVAECHRRGLRVVLDVLLHGVIDRESIRTAADHVRTGPIARLLSRSPGDLFAAGPEEGWRYDVSWSRHILDFEPYWIAGSPEVSPLVGDHPEWFYRDSSGRVGGVYTKAIDVRNPEARQWMLDSLVTLARRLDVDGFRLDAPTYNRFANWSAATRHRASASTLACLDMFRALRPLLRAWKPDFMLYTEPSGILHRETMDVTYNYDEQWLVGAALGAMPDRAAWAVSDGRSMARWLADRDALLPPGSLTCHHVDSHDTFWWPEWGEKWRREQFGSSATAAAVAAFSLWGGPFMTFVGGEVGLERDVELLAEVKARVPVLSTGSPDVDAITAEHEAVFAVLRRDDQHSAVVLVNFGSGELNGRASVAGLDGSAPMFSHAGAAGGSISVVEGTVRYHLPPHAWCVLATRESE